MTDTKLGKAFHQYVETLSRMVEWIIGLIIGELALIISQNLFCLNMLFYLFLIVSGTSILLAIMIMYVISSESDIELFSAILAKKNNLTPEEFEKEYFKRLGKLNGFLTNLVVEKGVYKLLFLLFLINSIIMILLIFDNIQNLMG